MSNCKCIAQRVAERTWVHGLRYLGLEDMSLALIKYENLCTSQATVSKRPLNSFASLDRGIGIRFPCHFLFYFLLDTAGLTHWCRFNYEITRTSTHHETRSWRSSAPFKTLRLLLVMTSRTHLLKNILLKPKDESLQTVRSTYLPTYLPMTYGAETWTLTARLVHRTLSELWKELCLGFLYGVESETRWSSRELKSPT
jgi:hypothetical protein